MELSKLQKKIEQLESKNTKLEAEKIKAEAKISKTARVMNWIDKSIERYNIFGFGLWAVCLKDNIASAAVAVSYGCKKLDEFIDSENETTVVYGITRTEWEKIQNIILHKNSLDTY